MWNINVLHNHKSVFTRKSFASSQPFVFEAANNSMAGEQERQEEGANVEHWSLFHASLQLSSCSQNNCYPWLYDQFAIWAHGMMGKEQIWKTHNYSPELGKKRLVIPPWSVQPLPQRVHRAARRGWGIEECYHNFVFHLKFLFFFSSHFFFSSFFITDYSQVSVVDLNHAGQATISSRRQILIRFLQVSSFWTTEKCKCPCYV